MDSSIWTPVFLRVVTSSPSAKVTLPLVKIASAAFAVATMLKPPCALKVLSLMLNVAISVVFTVVFLLIAVVKFVTAELRLMLLRREISPPVVVSRV